MSFKNLFMLAGFACLSVTISNPVSAQEDHSHHNKHNHMANSHDHHAAHFGHSKNPGGVMGGHMHNKGEWMVSYRYMHMDMHGSRDGTDDIDPLTIATSVTNPLGGPATFRVVPTDMTMDMHMLGAMYAPSDVVTVMVMANYLEKEMDHVTFAGMAGTGIRGTFTTESNGWGDTKLSSLIRVYEDDMHHVHLHAGLSLPTGSIDETAQVLTPMNTRPILRMPYSMQLGTGTYDLLPGVTYLGQADQWSWGGQYNAEIRLEDENDEGYSWGDKHSVSVWGAYEWAPWINNSLRLTGTTQDSIDGQDSQITAPVQTADPDNYGGETVELGIGVNLIAQKGPLEDQVFSIEANVPLYRDLNGPQLETDWTLTAGFKYLF